MSSFTRGHFCFFISFCTFSDPFPSLYAAKERGRSSNLPVRCSGSLQEPARSEGAAGAEGCASCGVCCPAQIQILCITWQFINLPPIAVIRCFKLRLVLFLQAFGSWCTRGVVTPPSLRPSTAAGVIYFSQFRVIARN